jgi:hypothetical protein
MEEDTSSNSYAAEQTLRFLVHRPRICASGDEIPLPLSKINENPSKKMGQRHLPLTFFVKFKLMFFGEMVRHFAG